MDLNICRCIRLWWRSKGFGVHSPFAYRFIREVLCLPEPYLDYMALGTDAQRLQYRLAAFLQPCGIEAVGGAEVAAALMACPQPPVAKAPAWALLPPARLSICGAGCHASDILCAAAGGNVLATGVGKGVVGEIRDKLPHGMTFASADGALVVISCDRLPRQDFDLFFS